MARYGRLIRFGVSAIRYWPSASRRMLAALARARIPHVGLLEPFRANLRRTGVPGYFDFDQHWNAAGHALAAELIAQALERQALLAAR